MIHDSMVYLGADHAGWHLKGELKTYLEESGYQYEDLGNKDLNSKDDYPDFVLAVGKKVAETGQKGIVICATGIGSCMAANKVKGVRAALVWDDFTAMRSREHNNANVLCLGAQILDSESAKKIVLLWLETKFTGKERHARRLKKIEEAEE